MTVRKTAEPGERIGVSGAAAILHYCEAYVRKLADSGAIPCERNDKGYRSFNVRDIEEHARRA